MNQPDDKVTKIEEKQRELDNLKESRDKLEALKREREAQLKSFIDQHPKEFIRLMCEAVLGIETEDENPFKIKADLGRYPSYVAGLAKIVLDKVMDANPAKSEDGYTPFLSVIFDYFHFSKFLRSDEIFKSFDLVSVQHDFFNEYADPLASAIDSASRFVFEGLPLYRKQEVEQGFEQLAFDDPIFMYVYKKGEYFESGPTVHVPDWVDGLYFKDSDWALHEAFFSGSGELSDGERDLRRSALRSRLGLQDGVGSPTKNTADTTALTGEIDRLKAELDEANAKAASLQSEALKGKARTTALKLIGGLAMVGAELDIHSGKIEGITDVLRDLSLKGVNVTDDTLRNYLKDAASVIGKPNSR